MLILAIDDVEITLSRDGETLYGEPGVAYVDQDGAVFGHEALKQSRLHPRQSHNQFWQRLNADPVAPAGPGIANQADLVYLHLAAIRAAAGLGAENDIVIAAPPTVEAPQLGMLLGIAAEAGFRVVAIVDASVAAASHLADRSAVSLLDVCWQRAFVARLETKPAADGSMQVQRTALDEVPAAGLAGLLEGWVDAVADRFVEDTRFDPLRIAETEQQVFDQVLAGIESNHAEHAIDVQHEGVSRRVNVGNRAFADKSEQRYRLLANAIGAPTTLALTDRARRLPGLAAFLQETHQVVPLPGDAATAAIAQHAELMTQQASGSGVNFIKALPASAETPAERRRNPPTHLLCADTAIALGHEAHASDHPAYEAAAPTFRLKRNERGVAIAPDEDADVALNGTRIDFEQLVHAGDRVVCGSVEFQLIAVLDAAPTSQQR